MPDKTVTQDKFNGTCDITMTLSVEETRLWRNMTSASRQALVGKFTELLGAELPEIQAALSQAIIPVGADEASKEAAKKAKPKFAGKAKTIYEAIANTTSIGLTDEEGQELLVMSGNSYRPARRALVKLGLVNKSGEFRQTRAGNRANAWVAIAKPSDLGV